MTALLEAFGLAAATAWLAWCVRSGARDAGVIPAAHAPRHARPANSRTVLGSPFIRGAHTEPSSTPILAVYAAAAALLAAGIVHALMWVRWFA